LSWPLTSGLGMALEQALSLAVRLDQHWAEKVAGLSGKVISIKLNQQPLTFYLQPVEQGILVQVNADQTADVAIRGSLAGFGKLLQARREGKTPVGTDVRFEGDVATGQAFETLMASLSPEWEAVLAQGLGISAAGFVASRLRSGFAALERQRGAARENLSDYIHHEAELLPPRLEFDDFAESVTHARGTLARLEARLKRLKAVL